MGFFLSMFFASGGSTILDTSGSKVIGKVTSGCPSPILKKNIAMGYVEKDYIKNGTAVKFEIRKKLYDAEVAKMPFLPSKYFNPK